MLIRPDGYVAWVGDGTDAGLRNALTTWSGSPDAAWREMASRLLRNVLDTAPKLARIITT